MIAEPEEVAQSTPPYMRDDVLPAPLRICGAGKPSSSNRGGPPDDAEPAVCGRSGGSQPRQSYQSGGLRASADT